MLGFESLYLWTSFPPLHVLVYGSGFTLLAVQQTSQGVLQFSLKDLKNPENLKKSK